MYGMSSLSLLLTVSHRLEDRPLAGPEMLRDVIFLYRTKDYNHLISRDVHRKDVHS